MARSRRVHEKSLVNRGAAAALSQRPRETRRSVLVVDHHDETAVVQLDALSFAPEAALPRADERPRDD